MFGNAFLGATEELLETGSDDKTLDWTLLATAEVVLVSAALAEVCVRFDIVLLGLITAGVSPVFVLTMGPRLILAVNVFTGQDQAVFDLLLKVLFVFFTAVCFSMVEALPEDCIPTSGCFLR